MIQQGDVRWAANSVSFSGRSVGDLLLALGEPKIFHRRSSYYLVEPLRDGKMIMGKTGQSAERMEALQALTDRLLSPDLTLAEARDLRGRVFDLTGVEESALSSLPCDGHRDASRPPGCRCFAA
jgi:hypothetical protein